VGFCLLSLSLSLSRSRFRGGHCDPEADKELNFNKYVELGPEYRPMSWWLW
jgi:hypothetical protein